MILTTHTLSEIAEKLDAIDPDWPSRFLTTDAAVVAYREELEEAGVKFPKPTRTIYTSGSGRREEPDDHADRPRDDTDEKVNDDLYREAFGHE